MNTGIKQRSINAQVDGTGRMQLSDDAKQLIRTGSRRLDTADFKNTYLISPKSIATAAFRANNASMKRSRSTSTAARDLSKRSGIFGSLYAMKSRWMAKGVEGF
jgi:hypothetical protein